MNILHQNYRVGINKPYSLIYVYLTLTFDSMVIKTFNIVYMPQAIIVQYMNQLHQKMKEN